MITGASSGIGSELGRQLAAKKAVVGLLARRAELLDELSNEISNFGGAARVFAVDVTDESVVRQAADALRSEFGKIDVLIANAGIGGAVDSQNLVAKDFARVLDVNLLGAVTSVAAVVPEMIGQRSGHLVAISSLAAYRGLPKSASYCASKAGLTAFFEVLRIDLRKTGVAVTTIHPGFIKTPLTAGRNSKMPFLMELPAAAKKIIRIIEKRPAIAAFPFPLSTFVRLGQIFPAKVYDYLASLASYRE